MTAATLPFMARALEPNATRYWFTRAALVLAVAAWSTVAAAQAPPAARDTLSYEGFSVDISELAGAKNRDRVLDALRRQIDICVNARLSADTLAFFRSVPVAIRVDEKGDSGSVGAYRGAIRGIIMRPQVYDPNRPILLHEYLHAYHYQKLPGGVQNGDVLTFYRRAKSTPGMYPPDSYMLSNVKEYFAMTASVFLHGSAARDPFTRDNLRTKQPIYFQWLEKVFGPR